MLIIGFSDRCLGRLVPFLRFLAVKNIETHKQDWKKRYVFLVTDLLDRYLAWRPIYINLISYITISIILNKLQYINTYCQLNYGIIIRKLLDATR